MSQLTNSARIGAAVALCVFALSAQAFADSPGKDFVILKAVPDYTAGRVVITITSKPRFKGNPSVTIGGER